MKKHRIGIALIVVAAVCLFMVPVGQSAPVVLKCGTVLPDSNILTMNARDFARRVAEKTDGRVKIEVYPASQLGGERDQAEGCQIGTQEMTVISTGVLSGFAPEIGVYSLPFIFNSWDHLDKVLTSSTGDKLKEVVLAKSRLRVLGWMEQGFRVTISVNKPIRSMADLKGMKIRVPEDKVLVRTFQLLGAAPTVIPWGEVYTALQSKVVDGMESTTPAILDMKFTEVAKYMAVTNHQHAVVALLMSDAAYRRLSAEDQKALNDAAREMLEVNYAQAYKVANSSLNTLRKQVKETTEPDLKPFQNAVAPIYDEFGKQTNTTSIIKEINAID